MLNHVPFKRFITCFKLDFLENLTTYNATVDALKQHSLQDLLNFNEKQWRTELKCHPGRRQKCRPSTTFSRFSVF